MEYVGLPTLIKKAGWQRGLRSWTLPGGLGSGPPRCVRKAMAFTPLLFLPFGLLLVPNVLFLEARREDPGGGAEPTQGGSRPPLHPPGTHEGGGGKKQGSKNSAKKEPNIFIFRPADGLKAAGPTHSHHPGGGGH